MRIKEFLGNLREDLPMWLEQFKSGDVFPHKQFFASRVVYYPGSGTDGHPVKLFGSTHCCHCFVYADYGLSQTTLEHELADARHGFRGYHTLARLQLGDYDIAPFGWSPHIPHDETRSYGYHLATTAASSFGFLEVLKRDDSRGDDYGAPRLAILFLKADGIASYDALFCQTHSVSPPFAVVLQDHGFGGNYSRFGSGGLLERIALNTKSLPPWLLVAETTKPWNGFEKVIDVNGDRGGMYSHVRALYRHE